jgi:hypothetical protein
MIGQYFHLFFGMVFGMGKIVQTENKHKKHKNRKNFSL